MDFRSRELKAPVCQPPLCPSAAPPAALRCPWWSQLPSATGEASLPSFQLAKSPSPSPVASPGVVGLCLDAWKLTSYDTHPLLPLRASGCPRTEAAAGPVGGLAGLFLICTCASETEEQAVPHAVLALSTVGAATSAWGGRQVLPETGEAALQQQVKLWPARGDKPVVRGTVPLLSWAVGAAGTKRAGPVLGPAGQHRPAITRPHWPWASLGPTSRHGPGPAQGAWVAGEEPKSRASMPSRADPGQCPRVCPR